MNGQDVRIQQINCQIQPDQLEEIRAALSFQLNFFQNIFEDTVSNTFTTKVFGSKEDYVKYSKEVEKFNPIRTHTMAFYSHELKEMVLHMEVDDFVTVFRHELSHAIFHYYSEDAPSWLSEGLAEYLEDVTLVNEEFAFQTEHAVKLFNARKLFEENELSKSIWNNFYSSTDDNYLTAWSFVNLLLSVNSGVFGSMMRSSMAYPEGKDLFNYEYPGGFDFFKSDIKMFYLNTRP